MKSTTTNNISGLNTCSSNASGFKKKVVSFAIAILAISVPAFAQQSSAVQKQVVCNLSIKAKAANAICSGTATGLITVNAKGGAGTYTYSLNGSIPQTSNVFQKLPLGSYSITVNDGTCIATTRTMVLEPEELKATTEIAPASCFGYTNGELTIIPAGGTPGYTFTLGNISKSTNSFSGLSAGNHIISITDAKGCSTTLTASIPEMTSLTTNAVATLTH
jgi:hypothetical protein